MAALRCCCVALRFVALRLCCVAVCSVALRVVAFVGCSVGTTAWHCIALPAAHSPSGGVTIVKALAENRTVTDLDLSDNKLGPQAKLRACGTHAHSGTRTRTRARAHARKHKHARTHTRTHSHPIRHAHGPSLARPSPSFVLRLTHRWRCSSRRSCSRRRGCAPSRSRTTR
jgi:hypothetical protein